MKKISLISLAIMSAFLLNLGVANAQSNFKNTFTVDAGFSLVGAIFSIPNDATSGSASSYSTPAFQMAFDHYMNNWFSLGAAVSFQQMGVKYDKYENSDGEVVDGDLNIKRLNFAARALFHYANKGRLDLYSGLRLGFTNWNIKKDYTAPENYDYGDIFDISGTHFSPQVVLLGVRGYFTENIGANMELCVGSPYYFALGLNYRF